MPDITFKLLPGGYVYARGPGAYNYGQWREYSRPKSGAFHPEASTRFIREVCAIVGAVPECPCCGNDFVWPPPPDGLYEDGMLGDCGCDGLSISCDEEQMYITGDCEVDHDD
jgi:hypothetical protein